MNKPSSNLHKAKSQLARALVYRPAESVNGALIVSRLLYAVLIVGFLGYYLDKALQIVKQ